jgi:hypothetical protein
MKILITAILIFSLSTQVFGQKRIILTQIPQRVPEAKKWLLKENMSTIIEINEGALISGSLCNAQMLSNPGLLNLINEGEYSRPNKIYQIEFDGITKVPYANDLTYKILSIRSFRSQNFPSIKYVKQNAIVFYPGDKVSVNACLTSLQLVETPFTEKDKIALKQSLKIQEEAAEKEAAQERGTYFQSNYKKTGEYQILNKNEKISVEIYNLPNRHLITNPEILDSMEHNGNADFDIKVDNSGNVKYVNIEGDYGNIIKDVPFINSIKEALLNSKFNMLDMTQEINIEGTEELQRGYIRLTFTSTQKKTLSKNNGTLPDPLTGLKRKQVITKLSKKEILDYYLRFHEKNVGDNFFYLPALSDGNDSCILVEIEKQGGLNVLKFSNQCD